MKIAIIADVHSNAPALEAVLSDISRYDIHNVVHLGDAFNGPIDPVGVAKLLQERQIIHIRGNGERMILSEDEKERFRSATFARERLSAEHLLWIRSWPIVYQQDDFFACHGSPKSDTAHLLEEITASGVRLRAIRAIQTDLEGIYSSLVLCAHSHVPRLVRLSSGTWVLNPGSVGLPAYSEQSPHPHTMEVGSPSARYAIAEKHPFGWSVSHVAVPYDYEKAASIADREGFYSWASALRTGYVS